MLSSKQIRSGFIDFFKDRKHQFVPSSPIVPVNDDTLLFANAGMNQFKDIFLGAGSREYTRAVNSQKCIRAGGKHNDLEDVGTDTYHHTFFEMLGNWSFGDYFKAEAIEWAWQLLTKTWKIDPQRLHATYFGGDKHDNLSADNEARDLWRRFLPDERVHSGNRKDNFWEMGDTGPCGPCSEIHYDGTPDKSGAKSVNAGSPDVIEIWNLVFIQFNRDENGKLTPLPAKHVDTGMGLERITRILQGKSSNYDTDLFMPIIDAIGKITGKKYTAGLEKETDIAFRVIADHLRTLVFAITDGGIPSNEGRGYVLRRILRRAARFGRTLGMHEPFIHKLVDVVIDEMSSAFEEIKQRAELVRTVIKSEEESFGRTLDRGLEIFHDAADRVRRNGTDTISGEDAFGLYDTYGFPLDLTQLMARERNLRVDTAGFDKLMEEQRQRARASQKTASLMTVLADVELPVTEDLHKYTSDNCCGRIVGFIDKDGFKNQGQIRAGTETGIILDKTCFYAEAGGQVGDCGTIELKSGKFIVENTSRIAGCVIHRGKVVDGTFSVGDDVKTIVSRDRDSIRKNHTATHLLQWALQQVIGKSVAQQGSLVCSDYLRFDFTCPKALTDEQIQKVEKLVREKIAEDLPVTCAVMPKEQAQKLDAMALFGEKYGDDVRVVAIGADDDADLSAAFSREFCGGTHVKRIGIIGSFKIIREESVSAGVRRITALTGNGLTEYLEKRGGIVDELSAILKVSAEELVDKVNKLLNENKKLTKELKSASKQAGSDAMTEAKSLLEKCKKIGDASVIVGRLSTNSVEQAREAVDMLKKKAKSAAIVFGFAEENKVTLLAAVTDDLIQKGLKAGDIVSQIAPIVGGGGGGRPQMAQAGGKMPEKLDDALAKAAELIKTSLSKS